MRSFIISALATCCIALIFSLTAFTCKEKSPATKSFTKANGKGFAVLELFTSEGCSSCPPADALFAEIQQEAKDKPVYLLAYHVDYWNRLGWKDVYSSADYSKRQTQYGRWFRANQIYTPQVIVNGKNEFVGSAGADIRRTISDALASDPGAGLVFQAHRENGGLKVEYQATGMVAGSQLSIAIVQRSAQTKVERGENAGHMLSHVQIVRKLQTEPLSTTGVGSSLITLPEGFNTQDWEVIGFIQDQDTGAIVAAARAGS